MSIEQARLSTQYYIERLRMQVNALRALQYPGDHPGPQKWLNLVWGMLDTAEEYLRKSIEPSEAQRKLEDSLSLTKQAYLHLDFMTGAGIDDLPHAVVKPLQRWFEQFSIQNTVFFHVEHSAIYELYPVEDDNFRRIREPAASLDSAIADISWPLFRVTVPSRELGIVPHLAIVAHEVGHALLPKITYDFSAFKEQEDALTGAVYSKHRDGSDDDPSVFLHTVTMAWVREIAADAVGFIVAGPAFYFGLCEFFQHAYGGYGLTSTHPPFDLRRDVLFARLNEGNPNFGQVFSHFAGLPLALEINSAMITPTPDKNQITQDMLQDMLADGKRDHGKAAVLANMPNYIRFIAPAIFEQTKTYIQSNHPQCIYSPEKFEADLSQHLESMLAAIPPIEAGSDLNNKRPTEFPTILNLGWVTLLAKLKQLQITNTGESKFGAQKAENLHSLLLKAVELSETRRLWDSLA